MTPELDLALQFAAFPGAAAHQFRSPSASSAWRRIATFAEHTEQTHTEPHETTPATPT